MHLIKRRLLSAVALVALVLVVFPAAASRAVEESPRDLVIDMTERFLAALQTQRGQVNDDPQVGYQLVEQMVYPHLDFPRFSQWVLGKHWRKANAAQREHFVREFHEFLARSYVTAMVAYADEVVSQAKSISYPPVRYRRDKSTAIAYTVIALDSGGSVTVNYRMHMTDDGTWKIYDVNVDGVSLAMMYRDNFSARIKQVGLRAFLDQLSERNRQAKS